MPKGNKLFGKINTLTSTIKYKTNNKKFASIVEDAYYYKYKKGLLRKEQFETIKSQILPNYGLKGFIKQKEPILSPEDELTSLLKKQKAVFSPGLDDFLKKTFRGSPSAKVRELFKEANENLEEFAKLLNKYDVESLGLKYKEEVILDYTN